MNRYEVVKSLGQGYFGKVLLVQDDSKKKYALKIQGGGKRYRDSHRLEQEAKIMMMCDHPFIIKGYSFCYVKNKAWILMDYILGKNLFELLHKLIVCPYDLARFYLSETALALDYLHSQKILYRDLKPDNILIGADGHVKMTDFGLSKILVGDKRGFSICGTPEYMAPEIIANNGYGLPADWWSFGVMAYELVTGVVPIRIEDKRQLKKMLTGVQINIPAYLPKDIIDFLTFMFVMDPDARPDFKKIQTTKWFESIDWTLLEQKAIPPPINIFDIQRKDKKIYKESWS